MRNAVFVFTAVLRDACSPLGKASKAVFALALGTGVNVLVLAVSQLELLL